MNWKFLNYLEKCKYHNVLIGRGHSTCIHPDRPKCKNIGRFYVTYNICIEEDCPGVLYKNRTISEHTKERRDERLSGQNV